MEARVTVLETGTKTFVERGRGAGADASEVEVDGAERANLFALIPVCWRLLQLNG